MKAIVTMIGMLVLAAVATAAPSLTGAWKMTVTGGPHGNAVMGLTLAQEGKNVTGTFVSGHTADMPVAGEFVDGELKLESTGGGPDDKVVFTAKLKQDGTLAGDISSPVGDMKWTAARVVEDKKK